MTRKMAKHPALAAPFGVGLPVDDGYARLSWRIGVPVVVPTEQAFGVGHELSLDGDPRTFRVTGHGPGYINVEVV